MRLSWPTLTSRLPRFSIRGLLLLTFVVAVFFAYFRIWTGSLWPQPGSGMTAVAFGLYAAVAAGLAIGLLQQARDIRRAMRQKGELETSLRRSTWWNIAWRLLLAGLIVFIFAIRYFRRADWLGPDFLSESPHYQEDQVWNATAPLSDSLLLVSLMVTNLTASPRTSQSFTRRLLITAGEGFGLAAAGLWLGFLLVQTVVLTDLTHLGIRSWEFGQPVFFHGHRLTRGGVPDPCIPLFYRMAISSLAAGVGLAAVRWLSKTWDQGMSRRIAPLAVFLLATGLQIHLILWAIRIGAAEASVNLWKSRPPIFSTTNFLGASLLLVGVVALAQRWRRVDEPPSGAALIWRQPKLSYANEWAIFVLPVFWIGNLAIFVFQRLAQDDDLSALLSFLENMGSCLVEPGMLVGLALTLTAGRRLYRWLREGDLAQGTEIRAGSTSPVLATSACLLVTAVLGIPALLLATFAGWVVLGGLPSR